MNDDRLGRALDRLFDADRASLLTEVVVAAVRRFDIDTSQLHNDSTSVRFTGEHSGAGHARGGKPTASITFGHSKDHRPDLRQLVWILTVSADGAVPIAHRVVSGNTSDDTTHISTWDELCTLVGRKDFLYVADSKLATRSAMDHIDSLGGRFVTVLPRTRKEDRWFRDWLTRNRPDWQEALSIRPRRSGEPPDILSTYEAPQPTGEGYRIVWVHSSAKATYDAMARAKRVQRSDPEDRDCSAPSAARLLEIFDGLGRHHIVRAGRVIQVVEPELSALQRQVLELLGVPQTAYRAT